MRLIRGAASSGKTALVLREFKTALLAGRRDVRLIVPTATLVRHLQHELARDGYVFRPDLVLSLHRFLFERAPDCAVVSDALLRAIVRESLADAQTDGLVETVAEAISLFENDGLTPQIRQWRTIERKIHAAGFHTRSELMRAAAKSREPLTLWLDGFQDLSRAEREFLAALDEVCQVTLTGPAGMHAAPLRLGQLRLGDEDIELPGAPRSPRATVIEANSPEQEAAEIARRIADVQAFGTPLRKIAVAVRNSELYVPLLRATLERFCIPARFYFAQPLASHPAAKFLNGLISGALEGRDFETTLDCLRAHPRFGRSVDFDRFDFAVREVMPGRGTEGLLSHCESERLRDELKQCLACDAWAGENHTPAEWAARFDDLATVLYRPGRFEPAHDHTSLAAARSHVAALAAWIEAIQSICGFWPAGNQISLESFWRVARPAIGAAVFQSADNRVEAVQVMSAYEARQWDVAALFVCGAVDGDYPQRKLPNVIGAEAGLRLPDDAAQERALFETLTTRASDFLFLTWPRHNAAGKSVEPSRYLDPFESREFAIACKPQSVLVASAVDSGRISSPALLTEMAALHATIGMSRLENLAQCRFKFFGERTLRLEGPPDRPEKRLSPRLLGLILHKTMELWLPDTSRNFVGIFEEVFEQVCQEEHVPPGYRLEVDRMMSRETARKICAGERWKADRIEVEKELELAFPNGVRITGRVDRIDTFDSYPGDCVIVDYKSGKLAGVERFVESRTKLQGPLYALAVREQLNLNPAAVLFWAIREDKLMGWGAVPGTAESFAPMSPTWALDVKTRMIERVTEFLAGHVHALPEEPDQCRWCDFAQACRYTAAEVPPLVMIEGAHGG